MKPSVTLAIPTSNRLAYLRETLNDALVQDYGNLEILVSDNGSDDETPSFLRSLTRSNSRIRCRRNPTRLPVSDHFNQCLAAAQGDFFVLVSDDDRINAGFISALVRSLSETPRATVAIPSNAIIDSGGRLIRRLPLPETTLYEGIDFAIEWLWKSRPLPVANLVTVMAQTDRMRQRGYQPFARGLNSDNLLFLQLALEGAISFVPEATFYWRTHDKQQNQMSSSKLIAQSARQFRALVRHDSEFHRLLQRHPPQKRKLVLEGVRYMTADFFLHAIGFFERPLAPNTLARLAANCLDLPLLQSVLLNYCRMARSRFPRRRPAPGA